MEKIGQFFFLEKREKHGIHSKGMEAGERRVLVYNLCTKQLKVFHIEKKIISMEC